MLIPADSKRRMFRYMETTNFKISEEHNAVILWYQRAEQFNINWGTGNMYVIHMGAGRLYSRRYLFDSGYGDSGTSTNITWDFNIDEWKTDNDPRISCIRKCFESLYLRYPIDHRNIWSYSKRNGYT